MTTQRSGAKHGPGRRVPVGQVLRPRLRARHQRALARPRPQPAHGEAVSRRCVSVQSCDLLPRDPAAEGHGRRPCQEVQEGRHSGHWRRRQRRLHDQE